jgi:hypothetical protein
VDDFPNDHHVQTDKDGGGVENADIHIYRGGIELEDQRQRYINVGVHLQTQLGLAVGELFEGVRVESEDTLAKDFVGGVDLVAGYDWNAPDLSDVLLNLES